MLIRYNKFDEQTRDRIRALESKGHIGYIRYMLLRRMALSDINQELMRLGLSWAQEDDLRLYFRNAMLPILQEYRIDAYYKYYKEGRRCDPLSISNTFQRTEIDRQQFCLCIQELEIEFFFANEILDFYGSRDNIPLNKQTGKPIIEIERVPELVDILNHQKRPMIETMLVDGKTPKMISDYLDKHYDIQLPAKEIGFFAAAFFKTKRRDLERTIDDLQEEVRKLEESIDIVRDASESKMTIGQKTAAIANAKVKIIQLTEIIKRLMGHHSHAAYQAGILEFAQIREMFADIMVRSHRRFVDLDASTEREIVPLLGTITKTMVNATDKIMALDEKMNTTTKKTISEEMLEVVMPSLDRVLEEEKEAYLKFQKEFGGDVPLGGQDNIPENVEILGLDD